MAYKDFTDMNVWKKAFDLLLKIYSITKNFPREEKYGMTSDIRRSANSVVHNIAEGFGRYEKRDKTRFYKISRGSAYEILSQIMASYALEFFNDYDEKEKMIYEYRNVISELDALIKTIETNDR